MCRLIESLFNHQKESRNYQGHLEFRIRCDSITIQSLRAYCVQLEKVASGLQSTRSQHEASAQYTSNLCQAMARDLDLEKGKVRELESLLNEVTPMVESLLRRLSDDRSSDDRKRIEELQKENQSQQSLILLLQSVVAEREEKVRDLRAVLEGAKVWYDHTEEYAQDEDEASVEIITD